MRRKQLTILCHMDKICFLGNQRNPLLSNAYVSWYFIRLVVKRAYYFDTDVIFKLRTEAAKSFTLSDTQSLSSRQEQSHCGDVEPVVQDYRDILENSVSHCHFA